MNHALIVAATLCLTVATSISVRAESSAPATSPTGSLFQQALVWLTLDTVDSRRQAVRALEEVVLLDPGDTEAEIALARAYERSGFLAKARTRYQHASLARPDDARLHRDLGRLWRNEWLQELDPGSLRSAKRELVQATILDTADAESWLLLQSLLTSDDEIGLATVTAFRAAKADPSRLEAILAVASVCQRLGLAHEADSLFRASIRYLGADLRAWFMDVTPLTDAAAAGARPRVAGAADFEAWWRTRDPDPATPENEALLEFWSRATQACLLFHDGRPGGTDARAVAWIRLGRPALMTRDPAGERLSTSFATGSEFPAGVQVWVYPDQGLKVTLYDRTLTRSYSLPVTRSADLSFRDPLRSERVELSAYAALDGLQPQVQRTVPTATRTPLDP
jgi:GWxTD domain-containing protein